MSSKNSAFTRNSSIEDNIQQTIVSSKIISPIKENFEESLNSFEEIKSEIIPSINPDRKTMSNFKKNRTIESLDKLEIVSNSHKLRYERMHSPLNLFNTFTPTHFSPKTLSPIKKTNSKSNFTYNSIKSLKSANISDFDIPLLTSENREMTPEIKTFLLNSFKHHFIFGFMDEGILDNILTTMKCFSLKADQILLKKLELVDCLYILETGEIIGLKEEENSKIRFYKSGSIIFDDLFFNNLPSQMKYISSQNTIIWGLPTSQIAFIILQINEKKYNENRSFIDPIPFFSKLTDTQKNSLAYNFKTLIFSKNAVIIKENEPGVNFYILKNGILIAKLKDTFVNYLKPGDCFGEEVFSQKKRGHSIIVESESAECLSMNKNSVLELFGEDFDKVNNKNLVRKFIGSSQSFSRLTSVQIEIMIGLIKYKKYEKEDEIIPKNNVILMLLEGKLTDYKMKIEILEGSILGEEFLIDPNYRIPYLLALNEVLIGECDLLELEMALGGKLKDLIEKNSNLHESLILSQKKIDSNSTLNIKVKAEDIKVLKILGEGYSGIVLLVEYENKLFALKIISKGWIIEKELEEYIRNEKEIYRFIDFPFITKLCYTFKDDLSINFLLEFVNGIELFTVLYNTKRFISEEAKFYIGTLILCLQFLHNKGIMHRDIKPENIIIDSFGYIKLCDLGIAKLMLSNSTRTYTLLGTKFYIAPEMIIGKGYSFPIDFWSLGICLYEFVCGDVPFGATEEEPYKIYQSIVMDKLSFPSFFKDRVAKDLIKKLLTKSPERRLGKTFGQIKGHPFFDNFEWDELMQRRMKPPFVPDDQELTLKTQELEVLKKKMKNLTELLASPDIVKVKEMTKMVKSNYENWDDIF